MATDYRGNAKNTKRSMKIRSMRKPIPYGRQFITDEDIQAVVGVLHSNNLTQGPKIGEFERAFAEYVSSKYAVAVSNGTAALHLSGMALKVKPGDKVITTPITFVASANCVRYCGGDVVFADIDPETFLLDIGKVKELLASSPPNTFKGIIPVDFAGYPVNLEAYRQLADEYGLWIIEDACHSPGGYFFDSKGKEQRCGNGRFAELSVFSFHPVKHIAAGEGGMITTNDEELYRKLLNLRTHGIQQDYGKLIENHGPWYYEMQELGFNYRLTDMQAALAMSQLKRAQQNLEKRHRIAKKYYEAFRNSPILTPIITRDVFHAYHLYVIRTEKRDELIKYLRQNNIMAQVHYIPVHYQPYYKNQGWKKGDLPVADEFYRKCLSIPLYPSITDDEQNYVIQKVIDFFDLKNAAT
ncbi:MAG: UDP-4-amino-4,6-dideoxy-N-acetyl-beta-L-altrosamine transaminase [Syntrophaceae bacterium]|nr:UDP-4-amino-4,6-dideoxy-N-acetyl-beta-L-altrosamine transaminase [Syntrophaceae bacterium]